MSKNRERALVTLSRRPAVLLVLLVGLTGAACFPTAPDRTETPPDTVGAVDEGADPGTQAGSEDASPEDSGTEGPSTEGPSTEDSSTEDPNAATPADPTQTSPQVIGETAPDFGASPSAPAANVGSFTTEELFAVGSGGCGMSLWRAGSDPRQDGFIFFNGLDGLAIMPIGDEMVALERKTATGDEFYGQFTSQTFVAPDATFSATTNVVLGEPGEIESVAIPAGTLVIQSNAEVTEIPVVGDAGC